MLSRHANERLGRFDVTKCRIIVSRGSVGFVRVIAPDIYGIPSDASARRQGADVPVPALSSQALSPCAAPRSGH